MKNRLLTILIASLLKTALLPGQVNVLELKSKDKFTEDINYNVSEKWISLTTYVFYTDLKNQNNNYTHQLGISFRNSGKVPLNQKINLKAAKDSVSYYYSYLSSKTIDKRIESGLFDGYIEFSELTDSSAKFTVDFSLLDDNGKVMKYFYKGQRSCKKKKIPTHEEKSAKLLKVGVDSLIKRLDTDWELYETMKAYWIGYTDEMYAIASKKDSVIDKLLNHINATKSLHGKIGAVYSLHLIGIDSKIEGRFVEKFTNANARKALLSLLGQKDLAPLIISLLARDPWPSDLPTLVNILKSNPNKVLVNSLFRYSKNEMPFRDNISENTDTINVILKDSSGSHSIGKIITVYKEKENEPQIRITDKENSFKSGDAINIGGNDNYTNKVNQLNHQGNVFIQAGTKGRVVRKFIANKAEAKTIQRHFKCSVDQITKSKCEDINNLLYELFRLSEEKVSVFSYCNFSDKYFHYLTSPNELTICDTEEASKRWLQFFKTKGY